MSDAEALRSAGKLVAERYRIVREVGTDERRTLYDAATIADSKPVTLALIRAEGTGIEQRLRNAEKLKTIEHPALARLLDVGKLDSGELFVVTERVAGSPLRELIADKPLPQRDALVIARQVLEALTAVHAAGAVHGDIKPETIVVATRLGEDRVKLAELGVSLLAGAAKPSVPIYSAPETALGPLDARGELYAVGAVLFELLTGKPPFFADSPEALRRLHAYSAPPTLKQRVPNKSFSDEVEAILASALARTRDRRFGSAADMIEAIDRGLATIVEETPRPSSPAVPTNNSLHLLAKDLMGPQAPAPRESEPAIIDNVSREVPELPPAERAQQAARRVIDRASDKLGVSRRKLIAGAAAAGGVVLLLMIVMCSGSSTDKDKSTDSKAPTTKVVSLEQRCEQIAAACSDTAKHIAKVVEQCKDAAKTQIEKKCTEPARAAYDCYEKSLCGKADKVWALDDFRVLAERRKACLAESKALAACLAH